MKRFAATLKYTVLLLPIAAVAGTAVLYRYGPPVWQLYVLYSVRLLTHPLIVLFLVLTVAALGAAMVLRRRHRSELLGFCFLLSAVLHLLTVALFSLWLVDQAVVEDTDTGGRHEVMTGLPAFAESTVGEDLRGLLQDIATRDRRALDARAETEQPVAEPVAPAEPTVTPPEPDQAAPARQPIPAVQAPAQPHVAEPLESRPSPTANRDTTQLVHMTPLETQPAPEPPARPPTPTFTVTPDTTSFKPTEQATSTPAAPAPDVARTTDDRAQVELVDIAPTEPRVDASLQQPEAAHPVDRLAMYRPRPEAMPTEQPAADAPAARDVSALMQPPARPTPTDAPAPAPAPELAPVAANPNSARLPQELPAFDAYARDVSERATDMAPRRSPASTEPVDLSGARPAPLPETTDRRPMQPRQPTPRELNSTRATDTPTDLRPMQPHPVVETPAMDYVPMAAPVETVSIRPLAAPNVVDALSAQPAARTLTPTPAVAKHMVTMDTPQDDASAAEARRPTRDLQAPHQAPSVVREPTPAVSVDRPHDIPVTQPRAMPSLADADTAPTAMPTAATPTTGDALPPAAPGRVPGAITVDVGGRLMLVEPAAHAVALQPAALTRRDIEAAYRRETTDSATALPAATLTAPSATPTVSPRSIAAADSVRMLQMPGQTPTIDAELAEVTPVPGHPGQVVEVSGALAAMTLPATGELARVHGLVDARTFARNRVAMQSPARAALPEEPTRRMLAVPAVSGTQEASVTFSPAASTPDTAMPRETPRARDDTLVTAAKVLPTRHFEAPVAGRVEQTPLAGAPDVAASALAGPEAPRDIETPRRHPVSDTVADTFVRPTSPTADARRDNPSPSTAPTWMIQAPALAERAAAVDGAAATASIGHSAQPAVRIDIQAPTAVIPTEAPTRLVGPTTATADNRELRVARAVARAEDAFPEDAIPPPRTTFLDGVPHRPSVAARLPPAATSGSSRDVPAARAADISDRLTEPKRDVPLRHQAPLMDVAVTRDAATGLSATPQNHPSGAPARDRTFALTRNEDRAWPTASGDPGRPAGLLPRPELPNRAQPRMRVELSPAKEPHAARIEDTTSSASNSVRGLMAAEIAASRESPSKKAIYQLRSSSQRREHIEELGGSVRTEAAVEQALDWLAGSQSSDGHWDVDNFEGSDVCGGRGNQASADVGITGLSLLAFLGAGYTHIGGKHQATVKQAVNWLIAGLDENGDLRRGGQMYDQAMATAALCETLSLTGDTRLLPAAKRAVQYILDAQSPEAAWRYNPREDSDTSVTGWQILALKSAEVAGISIPPEHYRWTEKWLDKVRHGEQGGLYLYQPGHAVTPVMTAEGWFCQIFMGEQSNTRGQEESTAYVMEHLPVWSREVPGAINFYYWYYATLALHLSGAETFGLWNDALTTALLQGRVNEGPAAGTWDPVSHVGVRGGRVYSTAMATLCLEVYYRFLPFYKLK